MSLKLLLDCADPAERRSYRHGSAHETSMEATLVSRGCGDTEGDGAGGVAAVTDAQPAVAVGAAAPRSIMFQLLSSDDDNFSDTDDGEDDAATTMGSPAAQAEPVTPPPAQATEAASELGRSGWIPAKQTARVAPPTRIEDMFTARPRRVHEVAPDEDEEGEGNFDSFPPASQQSDVVFSPSSQLHILSQISEMASMRAAREREAVTVAAATSVAPVSRPAHAWASAARSQQQTKTAAKTSKKRKQPTDPFASAKPRKSTKGISAVLATDISTWEAFDEPILMGDDAGEDEWSFDEISDSDF